jgi:hypothetical protein
MEVLLKVTFSQVCGGGGSSLEPNPVAPLPQLRADVAQWRRKVFFFGWILRIFYLFYEQVVIDGSTFWRFSHRPIQEI